MAAPTLLGLRQGSGFALEAGDVRCDGTGEGPEPRGFVVQTERLERLSMEREGLEHAGKGWGGTHSVEETLKEFGTETRLLSGRKWHR